MQNQYQNNQHGQIEEVASNGNGSRSVQDVWREYNLPSAPHSTALSAYSTGSLEWDLGVTGYAVQPFPDPALADMMTKMPQSDLMSFFQSVGPNGVPQASATVIPLTGPAGKLLGNGGGYHWGWEPAQESVTASSPTVPLTRSPGLETSGSSVPPEVSRAPKVPAAQAEYTRSLTHKLYEERILHERRMDESNDDVTARFIAAAYGYTSVQDLESRLSPARARSYGHPSGFASSILDFKRDLYRVDGTPAEIIAEAGVTCFQSFLKNSGHSSTITPEKHGAARMRMWAWLATEQRFEWSAPSLAQRPPAYQGNDLEYRS